MRCPKCGAKIRDGGDPTPLGQQVCQQCHDTIAGAVIGLGSGGGLGGALAGPGVLRWVRESLHPERKQERLRAEATARESSKG